MELKWFKPSTYKQGLSYIFSLIHRELRSLQPIDTPDIIWTRSLMGARAYLRNKSIAGTQSSAQTDYSESSIAQDTGHYFCIMEEIEEIVENGEVIETTSLVVCNSMNPDFVYAGSVKTADGRVINVEKTKLNKSTSTKYVYLVLDVSADPSVYITESYSSNLTSVSGAILIGSYIWDGENPAEITQVLKPTEPVEIGPPYIGPYCILPCAPSESELYNYVINPAGSLQVSSATCYVNGESAGVCFPVFSTVSDMNAVRAYVGWYAPVYDSTDGTMLSSGSVLLTTKESLVNGATVSKDITGNTSGVIDLMWKSAITHTMEYYLFSDNMLGS